MELVKEIIFSYGKVQLWNPELIRIEFFSKAMIGRKECIEVNNAIGILTEGKQALVLTVAAEDTNFDAEARDESSSPNGLRFTIADAFVARNLAQKLMVNFYLRFNKPAKPSKAFASEDEAIAWLRSQA
ncbi:MAG: hypothetical protein JST26_05095 [Bacteroidetes bacterium]|nr:hypothetical protein [Bacteroidota bacterium]